jgi:hypothetical protein
VRRFNIKSLILYFKQSPTITAIQAEARLHPGLQLLQVAKVAEVQEEDRIEFGYLKRLSQKRFQPPRHDPSGMTPLLWK